MTASFEEEAISTTWRRTMDRSSFSGPCYLLRYEPLVRLTEEADASLRQSLGAHHHVPPLPCSHGKRGKHYEPVAHGVLRRPREDAREASGAGLGARVRAGSRAGSQVADGRGRVRGAAASRLVSPFSTASPTAPRSTSTATSAVSSRGRSEAWCSWTKTSGGCSPASKARSRAVHVRSPWCGVSWSLEPRFSHMMTGIGKRQVGLAVLPLGRKWEPPFASYH